MRFNQDNWTTGKAEIVITEGKYRQEEEGKIEVIENLLHTKRGESDDI